MPDLLLVAGLAADVLAGAPGLALAGSRSLSERDEFGALNGAPGLFRAPRRARRPARPRGPRPRAVRVAAARGPALAEPAHCRPTTPVPRRALRQAGRARARKRRPGGATRPPHPLAVPQHRGGRPLERIHATHPLDPARRGGRGRPRLPRRQPDRRRLPACSSPTTRPPRSPQLAAQRPDLVLCDVNGDTLELIDAVRGADGLAAGSTPTRR